MKYESLIQLKLRRGMASSEAAKLLRKMADRIETNQIDLLNLPIGKCGYLTDDGAIIDDDGSIDEFFDPSGNPKP